MSNPHQFILAYCEENENYAVEFVQSVNLADVTLHQLTCASLSEGQSISEHLLASDQAVILMISDNFLKSVSCIHNGLHLLQTLIDTHRLQTIITNGIQKNNIVPTQFDRMSNVIHYMNFWQDKYLEMRKQKREIDPSEEVSFGEQLKIVRGISSEIGEFLRLLRTTDYWNFELLKKSNFLPFYHTIGQPELAETYQPSTSSSTVISNNKIENKITEEIDSISNPTIIPPTIHVEQETIELPEEEIIAVPEIPEVQEEVIEMKAEETKEIEGEQFIDKLIEHKKNQEEEEIENDVSTEIPDLDKVIEEIVADENEITDKEILNSQNEDLEILFKEEKEEPRKIIKEEIKEVINIPKEKTETQAMSIPDILKETKNLANAGKVDSSLILLQKAIDHNPKDSSLRYQYALFVAKYLGDYQKAANQLVQLLEYDQYNKNAYYLLAELAEMNNDHLSAKNYFEKVVTIDPKYSGVYYKLGVITEAYFPEQKKLAAKYYKKAYKQNKENTEALFRHALLTLENKGDVPKAIKKLKGVLKQSPNHPDANFHLAHIYHQLENYKKAFKHYQAAIAINPAYQNDKNDALFNLTIPESVETLGTDLAELENKQVELPTQTKPIKKNYPKDNEIVVLITGATAGIGQATAEKFAQNGYRLILTGRRTDRLDQQSDYFQKEYNTHVTTLAFDIRHISEVKNALASLPDEWKNIDILINNAGLASGFDFIHEGSLEDWEVMIDTNVKGLLYITRLIAPQMVKRKSGHIINVASSAGKEVYPKGNVYCATKFAVDALTKGMRLDLYEHNIRVSQVSPGHVEETEFSLVRFHGDTDRAKIYKDFNPLKSKDVAKTIYFISTQPAHVNIQDISMMGTQQASNIFTDRKGRIYDEES